MPQSQGTDDRDKARFISFATGATVFIVLLIYAFTKIHYLEHQDDLRRARETLPSETTLHFSDFWVFAVFEVVGVGAFCLMKGGAVAVFSPYTAAGRLPDPVPQDGEPEGLKKLVPLHKSKQLPIGVALILLGVAYLVYRTGGPTGSPYAQLLFAQVILGQVLITSAAPLDENVDIQGVKGSLKRAKSFLVLASSGIAVFLALTLAEQLKPTLAPQTSPWVHLVITVLNILISTGINYELFKRSHRVAPSGGKGD